jgi:hypothetical protein
VLIGAVVEVLVGLPGEPVVTVVVVGVWVKVVVALLVDATVEVVDGDGVVIGPGTVVVVVEGLTVVGVSVNGTAVAGARVLGETVVGGIGVGGT